MVPCVVSAVKSGAVSLMRNDMVFLLCKYAEDFNALHPQLGVAAESQYEIFARTVTDILPAVHFIGGDVSDRAGSELGRLTFDGHFECSSLYHHHLLVDMAMGRVWSKSRGQLGEVHIHVVPAVRGAGKHCALLVLPAGLHGHLFIREAGRRVRGER